MTYAQDTIQLVTLQNKKIGTSIKTQTDDNVMYPSVTLCGLIYTGKKTTFSLDWMDQDVENFFSRIDYSYLLDKE